MKLRADAVFEGGGVKGLGLVGAVAAIEDAGYEFMNVAGTSAGAIVASLLAVDYKADEIKEEMQKLDYNNFKDQGLLEFLRIGCDRQGDALWKVGGTVIPGEVGRIHCRGRRQ